MTLHYSPNNSGAEISETPRVLYLDDDQGNLDSFRANFRNEFEIFVATTPVEAYNLIETERIQIVITVADYIIDITKLEEFNSSIDIVRVQLRK